MVEVKNEASILVVKTQGTTPFISLKLRWEDDINMNFKEVVCEGLYWCQLDHDKVK
jgi:hypothetical protein